MGRTDINQTCLLPTTDNLNRKAQSRFSKWNEKLRILGHTQRIGCHHAHGIGLKAAQTLGKSTECFQRPLLRNGIELLFTG